MAKRVRKELDLKSLEGRLLFIFRENKDYEIGEILSCKRETVSGWRAGKSKPTLDHITKAVEVSNVDSDWILTGKTQSIESITYAFFPVYFDKKTILQPHAYEQARYFAGYAISVSKNKKKFDIGIHVSAAYYRHAILEDAPDPETEMYGKFEYQPDFEDYLIYISKIDIPQDFLNIYGEKIHLMINYLESEKKSYPQKHKTKIDSNQTKQSLNSTSTPNDFYEIPYFPDGIAAGNPKEIKEYPDGVVILHKDWCAHPLETSAARLDDSAHSMEPTIMAGSIITVDHAITDPKELDGEVVAIHKNYAGITVKRLKKIGDRWCGIPDNPEYEVIELEEGDCIIGLVTTHHNLISHKR